MSLPKSPPAARSRYPGLAGMLALVALWALPLAILGSSLYGAKFEQRQTTSGATPVEVTVGARDSAMKQAVNVTVETGPHPEVFGQGTGTITSVDIHAGSEVKPGQQLLSLDGRPVLAMVGDFPLYRDLKLGDVGSDVAALSKLLSTANLLNADDEGQTFGAPLDSAVRRFQSQAGQRPDGVFSPGSVAYIPSGFGIVSNVSATRGQVVSGTWTLMVGAESVTNLTIQPTTDGAVLQDVEGTAVIQIGKTRVKLSSITPAVADAKPLVAALQGGISRGVTTVATSDDGGTTTHIYSGAVLEAGKRSSLGSVPSTAIFTSGSGKSCLFARVQGQGKTGLQVRAVPLSDVLTDSAGVGQTLVDASSIGTKVLRDPSGLQPSELARCR